MSKSREKNGYYFLSGKKVPENFKISQKGYSLSRDFFFAEIPVAEITKYTWKIIEDDVEKIYSNDTGHLESPQLSEDGITCKIRVYTKIQMDQKKPLRDTKSYQKITRENFDLSSELHVRKETREYYFVKKDANGNEEKTRVYNYIQMQDAKQKQAAKKNLTQSASTQSKSETESNSKLPSLESSSSIMQAFASLSSNSSSTRSSTSQTQCISLNYISQEEFSNLHLTFSSNIPVPPNYDCIWEKDNAGKKSYFALVPKATVTRFSLWMNKDGEAQDAILNSLVKVPVNPKDSERKRYRPHSGQVTQLSTILQSTINDNQRQSESSSPQPSKKQKLNGPSNS